MCNLIVECHGIIFFTDFAGEHIIFLPPQVFHPVITPQVYTLRHAHAYYGSFAKTSEQ